MKTHLYLDRRSFLGVGLALASWPLVACDPLQARPVQADKRVRLRQLGIVTGVLSPGRFNAITDVEGVAVGHTTIIAGEGPLVRGKGPVRTGVTAVLPHGGNIVREHVFAADHVLNGNGEMTGVGFVRRTGRLASPVLLTNTSSVGAVYDAAMEYLLQLEPDLFAGSLRPEPVVGETWADFLNDTAGRHLRRRHVLGALEGARAGEVSEGCVGGGTGMRAFGFKAGIGTASRLVPCDGRTCTVGVLVQANFGRRPQLRVAGVPVGREITDFLPERGEASGNKSLLVIIATDAPLIPRQLRRLCKRVALGMARTGAVSTHGSGDLALAFSTAQRLSNAQVRTLSMLKDSALSQVFQGVVEATEEAILNALTMAYTMVGRDGNTIHALPLDRLVDVMRDYGRLK